MKRRKQLKYKRKGIDYFEKLSKEVIKVWSDSLYRDAGLRRNDVDSIKRNA